MYSNVLSFFLYFYLFIFFSVPVILFVFFIIIFSVTQLKYCIVSFYIHCWQSSKLLLSHSTPLLTLFTSKSPSTCSNLCLFHHIHSVTYTAFEELSRWPCPIVNTVLLISFASQPLSYTKHISHKSHRCIALPIHTHMYLITSLFSLVPPSLLSTLYTAPPALTLFRQSPLPLYTTSGIELLQKSKLQFPVPCLI